MRNCPAPPGVGNNTQLELPYYPNIQGLYLVTELFGIAKTAKLCFCRPFFFTSFFWASKRKRDKLTKEKYFLN
jgi:hypothetical protein